MIFKVIIAAFAITTVLLSVDESPNLSTELTESTIHISSIDRLYFSDLRKYRMGAKEVPADIKKYDGKTVQIIGFMVPFDSIEKIDKFILLQAPFMGCFHVPPPQPNESLMIESGNTNVKYTYEPIRITGRLKIEETYIDRYLVSLYTIEATKFEEVNQDDAELDGLPAGFHMFGEF
jgi:hypothetical protein